MRMKSVLEIATNVSILAVCVMLGWLFLTKRSLFSKIDAADNSTIAASITGKHMPSLPEYSWKDHSKTLVLAMQEGCHFCEDSMPFYRKLMSQGASGKLNATLLVIEPNDSETVVQHLDSEGLKIPVVSDRPLKSIYVSETPTLLVVDSKGLVEQAWVGELTSQDESRLNKTLTVSH